MIPWTRTRTDGLDEEPLQLSENDSEIDNQPDSTVPT